MKIHEYNEMMAYLTRPGMRTGGTIGGGTIQGQNMGYRTGFVDPNLVRKQEAIKNLNKKWTPVKVTEAAEILYPNQDIAEVISDNVKRRKIDTNKNKYGKE